MQNNVKSLLSIVGISLFVLIAAASFGPDEATNTTVKIGNCEPKPPINVSAKVNVLIIDHSGNPVNAGSGSLLISDLRVKDDSCTYELQDFYNEHVDIEPNGTYHFETNTNQHKNSQDLYRVELFFRIAGKESRTIKTLKYDKSTVTFTLEIPEPEYP